MWTLKSRTVAKNLQATVPGERLMMHVTTVWEQGDETAEIPFVIESVDLMERTILSVSDRLNSLDQAIAQTETRPLMPERPAEPQPVPPTAEEIKAFEIAQKEVEVAEEVELAKVRQLAETDPALAAKLTELETLKTASIIKN